MRVESLTFIDKWNIGPALSHFFSVYKLTNMLWDHRAKWSDSRTTGQTKHKALQLVFTFLIIHQLTVYIVKTSRLVHSLPLRIKE